jgi:hypothetical protein
MEEENDPSFSPSHSQYSISTLLLNILTILNGGVLGTSRVIASQDDFETSWGTYLLYENQTEFIYDLITYKGKFDEAIASQLKPIWENLKATWKKNESNPRINNVLDFFYFSWHTLTLQQTMICLSIVLETLFAPHSNTELVHQISFNVAKFLGKNELDRMEIYKYIKKYYSIRSKLVHGETISEDDLKSIPEFFKFTCNIILKIISDAELIHIFNNNQLRKIYIEQQLFN